MSLAVHSEISVCSRKKTNFVCTNTSFDKKINYFCFLEVNEVIFIYIDQFDFSLNLLTPF
jgi:hypothetical protein